MRRLPAPRAPSPVSARRSRPPASTEFSPDGHLECSSLFPRQPSDLRSLKAISASEHRATQDASLPPQGGELATVTPIRVPVRASLARHGAIQIEFNVATQPISDQEKWGDR
jgi:hypothetical protein